MSDPPDPVGGSNAGPASRTDATATTSGTAPEGDRVVAAHIHASASSWPDPQVLQGYERLAPGAAERLVSAWEEQGRHRRKLESRGQWLAFIIALAGMATAVMCAALGAAYVGGAVAVAAVLGISLTSAARLLPRR